MALVSFLGLFRLFVLSRAPEGDSERWFFEWPSAGARRVQPLSFGILTYTHLAKHYDHCGGAAGASVSMTDWSGTSKTTVRIHQDVPGQCWSSINWIAFLGSVV